MKKVELISFPSPSALAQAAAERWLESLASLFQSNESPKVALSGGRIAKDFFVAVAQTATARKISLASVHFFWGDERCVPPTDPESNYSLAEQCLLRPLAIAEAQIHRIRGEDPPPVAAARARDELRALGSTLDLVFLGLGEDGHVASLFPRSFVDPPDSAELYRAVIGSKPPPQRITLTYPAIVRARNVWVLASGTGKEEALRSSLDPAGTTPLARILALRSHTQILTDIPNGVSYA